MKILTFDVMLRDRFVCTLKYRYCPLFPLDLKDLERFALSKRPTLRGQQYRIVLCNDNQDKMS